MFCFLTHTSKAQQTATLYFMDDVPVRHLLNPAFQPTTKYYISLPVLGYVYGDYNNNSFTLNDLDNLNLTALYNKLNDNTYISVNSQINLLSTGYAFNNSFLSFTISQKADFHNVFPKDLFKFFIYGTTEDDNNYFSLNALSINANVYTETAFGLSQQMDEQWTFGMKLKLLNGNFNLNYANNLFLSAKVENWKLQGNANLKYSGPVQVNFDEIVNSPTFIIPQKNIDLFKYNGLGAGIDFGVQYRMLQNLYLSASITDFGFIKWKNNILNNQVNADYSFDGFVHLNSDMSPNEINTEFENLFAEYNISDSLISALNNSIIVNPSTQKYTTYTTSKVFAAVQYYLLSDKLNFGLLYSTFLNNNFGLNKITASINSKPFDWLNASLSYSFLNSYNSFGCGLGVKFGIFHFYTAMDCISFSYSKIPISGIEIPLPYNQKYVNFNAGINIVFGERERKTDFITNQPYNPFTGIYKPKFKKDKFLWDK